MKFNDEEVNAEWIEKKAKERNRLHLIKAYKDATHFGLKESMEAVDSCEMSIPALLTLFAPFILSVEQYQKAQEALAKARQEEHDRKKKEMDRETTDTILSGIRTACNNWYVLGFDSKLQACRSVLNNLKDKLPELA
jgi:hypothetical protein